ncbi:DUF7520 family protein [Halococcus morrhuae DSM 1307]|nr:MULTISPECIES: cox cluster protein [Halococcus]UOO96259.1 cox cluster protein [Halococcus dombrowskii]
MSETPTRGRQADYSGRSVVFGIYCVAIGVAGVMGFLLGMIGPDALRSVKLFFLIEMPPTPLGLAVYGMVTLATILGVLLLAVRFVSRRYGDRDR